MNLFKKISILAMIAFIPSDAISEEIEPGLHILVNKDWGYMYTDAGIFCSVGNHFTENEDIENMDVDELIAFLKKRNAAREDGSDFLGKTFLEFTFFPQYDTVALGLLNSNLNNRPKENVSVSFNFDNKVTKTISGVVPDYKVPWMNQMFAEPSANWTVGFPHKEFIRNIVPNFKKGSQVKISVNGTFLQQISLSGFTKSFQKFEACTAGKIKVDLHDPF